MIRFLVKGAYFRGAEARDISESLEEGMHVTIKRDSENEHDDYACSVHFEDVHIGYVQAEIAYAVAEIFDEEGHESLQGLVIGRDNSTRMSYPEVELVYP